ncbi:MAG: MFS transporter [Candidatus Lokiarchaeota archaeon]|nr:MFS transporter [Candidatus Lokiarchaeota archaeon]MBD3199103.1 MFS transporter [Candidatus Lokiarchaeota archaeon]
MTNNRDLSRFTVLVIVIAAAIAWMHDGYSLVLISTLSTQLQDFFIGITTTEIGLVISLQFVFTVPGAILFGELGDRFGRKKALIISIGWDAIFSSMTGIVPPDAFWLFAVLRLLSGLGVSWGISFSLISEYFKPKRRGAVGGLVHSTFVFGYVGAILTSMIIGPIGWQWCFLTALFPLPFLVLFWFYLPESAVWSEFDRIQKETGKKQKLRIRELFSEKWAKLTVLLIVLFWMAETAYHALVDHAPEFFEYLFAISGATNPKTTSLLYMLVIMLIAAGGLFFFGFLSDYIGRKKAFALDNLLGIIGGVIFVFFTLVLFNQTLILVSSIIITLGFGLHGIFGVWSSELYDTELRASANSIIFSVARGLSFGAFFVGLIADSLNPYTTIADRLANPSISLQALGTGMILSLIASIGVFISLLFVPEPVDKNITALSKADVLKP